MLFSGFVVSYLTKILTVQKTGQNIGVTLYSLEKCYEQLENLRFWREFGIRLSKGETSNNVDQRKI